MKQDFAIIRLSPSFAEAKQLFDPSISDPSLRYHTYIRLYPDSFYTQKTNCPLGIAFDGDYQVLVVDCADNELADITANVGIEEFTHTDGTQQITWEVAYLNVDFHNKSVYLKFIHTTGSEIWYSNPITITSDDSAEVLRFDYKSSGLCNGIDYPRADFYNSIGIMGSWEEPAYKTESRGYTNFSNKNITAGKRTIRNWNFRFTYLNPFLIDTISAIFEHDIIYIDGYRITDKPDLKYDKRLGNSNLLEGIFEACIDKTDTYTPELQIIPQLELLEFTPEGSYTLSSLPVTISGEFNKDVTLGMGTIKVYDASDGSLLSTYTQDDIVIGDYVVDGNPFFAPNSVFTIVTEGIVSEIGDYYVLISNGLFKSGFDIFLGVVNENERTFSVGSAYYDPAYFDEEYYFAN